MAQWRIQKYSTRRWVPRLGQIFAVASGSNIFEGKRQEFLHDAQMPFVFRNKNQVRFVQVYLNKLIELRSKYECPVPGEDYYFLDGTGFSIRKNFGESIMDWYHYDNWFILSDKILSEELWTYSESLRNYLRVVEDMYVDDYWKARQQKTI